jgi:hypothetical protein
MGASPAFGGGPGYPLVSFLPVAKKDTASIPCAFPGNGICSLWVFASLDPFARRFFNSANHFNLWRCHFSKSRYITLDYLYAIGWQKW